MAQVDVSVNGQSYRIACEDGQEDRLVDLAAMVEGKVLDLVNQIGQVGSNRLLVMAALIRADELVDLKNEAGSLQEQKDNLLSLYWVYQNHPLQKYDLHKELCLNQ